MADREREGRRIGHSHLGEQFVADRQPTSKPSARIHLPERRRASPWTRWVVLAMIAVAILSLPLWIDPTTMAELRGEPPRSSQSAPPTPNASGGVASPIAGRVQP